MGDIVLVGQIEEVRGCGDRDNLLSVRAPSRHALTEKRNKTVEGGCRSCAPLVANDERHHRAEDAQPVVELAGTEVLTALLPAPYLATAR